mmetsp:Transcript_22465/g.33376  ORF Transcript_22465/g.33376 Transcript_22465/m.33376 type:complete len:153 (-) Transcript_22465:89-547(-)
MLLAMEHVGSGSWQQKTLPGQIDEQCTVIIVDYHYQRICILRHPFQNSHRCAEVALSNEISRKNTPVRNLVQNLEPRKTLVQHLPMVRNVKNQNRGEYDSYFRLSIDDDNIVEDGAVLPLALLFSVNNRRHYPSLAPSSSTSGQRGLLCPLC